MIVGGEEELAWAIGVGEVVGYMAVRQHDRVLPTHSVAAPPGVVLDIATDGMLRTDDLLDGVDTVLAPAARLPPLARLVDGDIAALHLEGDDPSVGNEHDEVGLVVLLFIDETQVADHDVGVVELTDQPLPDLPLRVVLELRIFGVGDCHVVPSQGRISLILGKIATWEAPGCQARGSFAIQALNIATAAQIPPARTMHRDQRRWR